MQPQDPLPVRRAAIDFAHLNDSYMVYPDGSSSEMAATQNLQAMGWDHRGAVHNCSVTGNDDTPTAVMSLGSSDRLPCPREIHRGGDRGRDDRQPGSASPPTVRATSLTGLASTSVRSGVVRARPEGGRRTGRAAGERGRRHGPAQSSRASTARATARAAGSAGRRQVPRGSRARAGVAASRAPPRWRGRTARPAPQTSRSA